MGTAQSSNIYNIQPRGDFCSCSSCDFVREDELPRENKHQIFIFTNRIQTRILTRRNNPPKLAGGREEDEGPKPSGPGIFIDPDFECTNRSITKWEDMFHFFVSEQPIEWVCPVDIHEQAMMTTSGITRLDIRDQIWGDPNLMAAVAFLATRPEIFKKVVHNHSTKLYKGRNMMKRLRFNFYQFDHWESVYIDHRLPVLRKSDDTFRLPFMKSTISREMWIPLLEKAYAKMKGCYDEIINQDPADPFNDFTGGIAYTIELEETDSCWMELRVCLKAKTTTGFLTGPVKGRTFNTVRNTQDEVAFGPKTFHGYHVISCFNAATPTGKMRMLILKPLWDSYYIFRGSTGRKLDIDNFEKRPAKNMLERGTLYMPFEDMCAYFRKMVMLSVIPENIKKPLNSKSRDSDLDDSDASDATFDDLSLDDKAFQQLMRNLVLEDQNDEESDEELKELEYYNYREVQLPWNHIDKCGSPLSTHFKTAITRQLLIWPRRIKSPVRQLYQITVGFAQRHIQANNPTTHPTLFYKQNPHVSLHVYQIERAHPPKRPYSTYYMDWLYKQELYLGRNLWSKKRKDVYNIPATSRNSIAGNFNADPIYCYLLVACTMDVHTCADILLRVYSPFLQFKLINLDRTKKAKF